MNQFHEILEYTTIILIPKHIILFRAFNTLPQEDSEEDDADAVKEDIVIVPTYSSKTKFISKMVKFAKTYFDIKYHAIEENNGGLNINDSSSILHTVSHQNHQIKLLRFHEFKKKFSFFKKNSVKIILKIFCHTVF